jgi:hypothetical protein
MVCVGVRWCVCVVCFSVLVSARCAAPGAAPPEFNPPGLFALAIATTEIISRVRCPTGMVPMPIGSDLCQRAAAVAARPYGGNLTANYMPVGCLWYSAGGSFYFNALPYVNVNGASHASVQPVCAGAPDSTQQQFSVECPSSVQQQYQSR